MHPLVFHVAIAWTAILVAVLIGLVMTSRSVLARILALDTLTLALIALLALTAHAERRSFYLDAALALALLSFVGTLAAARLLGERRGFD